MDEQRYRELLEKRDAEGLTDDEADELGRLIAEDQGQAYEGRARAHPDDERERREPERDGPSFEGPKEDVTPPG